jgi:GH35 family endo-1,4-beta-xylanase
VTVRQVRHKFLFGCNAFLLSPQDQSREQQDYQERFTAIFNYATLGFYWGSYEPQEGQTAEARLRAQARWLRDHGIAVKGHPLAWYMSQPTWLNAKTPEQAWDLQLARSARETRAFAGLIDWWDAVNEVVHTQQEIKPEPGPPKNAALLDQWHRLGGVDVVAKTFAAAARGNPKATLVLNDYAVAEDYVHLIQGCLEAGVKIDKIGIQSHMHDRYWPPKQTWTVLERFAKLGKPIHFTELTIISGPKRTKIDYSEHATDWFSTPQGEADQARQVTEFYTLLFSHPSVEAITWWDLPDGEWLGAPGGLVRQDMSPKPAYEALLKLVKETWWTPPQKLTTDARGTVNFHAFLGAYEVERGDAKGRFQVDAPGRQNVTAALAGI